MIRIIRHYWPFILVMLFCITMGGLLCRLTAEIDVVVIESIDDRDDSQSIELPSSSDIFGVSSGNSLLQTAARNISFSFSAQAVRLRFEQITILHRFCILRLTDAIIFARKHTLYYIYALCKMRN